MNTVGHALTPKMKCIFAPSLRQKVIDANGKYVTVYGRKVFKARDLFPYEMQIDDIEWYADEKDLPPLSTLKGIAPKATGELSAASFIRESRNDWI